MKAALFVGLISCGPAQHDRYGEPLHPGESPEATASVDAVSADAAMLYDGTGGDDGDAGVDALKDWQIIEQVTHDNPRGPEPKPDPVADTWQPPEPDADYGKYPANYNQLIRAWFLANAKDPEAIKYQRISRPRHEYWVHNWQQHSVTYGWSVCAIVNEKNGYGAYTGYHAEWFFFVTGRIWQQQSQPDSDFVNHDHRMSCDDGGK